MSSYLSSPPSQGRPRQPPSARPFNAAFFLQQENSPARGPGPYAAPVQGNQQPERQLPPLCLYSSEDSALQATTDDAASSKLSAVLLNYYRDDSLPFFVKKRTRRAPLINRGYFSRVAAIRQLLAIFVDDVCSQYRDMSSLHRSQSQPPSSSVFLSAVEIERRAAGYDKGPLPTEWPIDNPPVQFVNFGAGMDTLYFWLAERYKNIKVFEVDFSEVAAVKECILRHNPDLWKKIAPSSPADFHSVAAESHAGEGVGLNTEKYALIGADLRDVQSVESALKKKGFRDDLPTFFLSECVLVYMNTPEADAVLRWAAKAVKSAPSVVAVYEQLNPDDAFGRTMVKNLQTRGCPLMTIFDYPTLQAQKQRYINLGWSASSVADMNTVYDKFLPREETQRVQRLELFDELEEWRLIQAHYSIAVAVSDPVQCEHGRNGNEKMTLPRLKQIYEGMN
ncbi:leucine carboxyl methyltransferase [Toxoplasma gondii VEG]|uniref:[phosphatase 2A protein]-leucine-carboxy methyltransferase n=4 Tax=Toxoplasma gondii TaxID=5811 RepID=B9Q799_TOXGV|nr:leucine carboxyl methyltransferase [Toxoplasma gondii VEG]KFG44318.1 leucine carboxyl methyltransferase [Toxoplasma gondii FOU]PUA86493.1 leucine carboxyl methyltransferase [Toxoplasma gondii TgCATBr9]RQX70053.1 leucine carboxyl methyltransferase [Toxoplasma gondii CAST]CEL77002.1 TPA: leucine carboxyl methyltransferase, putative [Toxoplasma gondii VEG]